VAQKLWAESTEIRQFKSGFSAFPNGRLLTIKIFSARGRSL
jgi:hypothetical protein